MYVKLGIEWETFYNDEKFYLSNIFNSRLFTIEEKYKQCIMKKIESGVDLHELEEEYGDKWLEFKKELMENQVIIFSEHKNTYKDKLNYGLKMINSSSFFKKRNDIGQAFIEINNFCSENCDFCQKDCEYPCLACYSGKGEKQEISKKVIDKFVEDTKGVDIKQVVFIGGQVFESAEIMKYCLKELRSKQVLQNVYIIINGKGINDDDVKWIKENNILPIINIISNESDYIEGLKNLLNIFQENKVSVLFQGRIDNNLQNKLPMSMNYSIQELINKQGAIVTDNNLVNGCSVYTNSYAGIRNMCTYGKILIHTDGTVGICREYDEGYGNILKENTLEVSLKLQSQWNDGYSIDKCEQCSFGKICRNCQGILKRYEHNEKLCLVNKSYERR